MLLVVVVEEDSCKIATVYTYSFLSISKSTISPEAPLISMPRGFDAIR